MVKQKEKGNALERKMSKILSKWMFDNDTVLFRDSTSGGRKVVYKGDIVPVKQLVEFGWKSFPFLIETKCGYKPHTPTFTNQTQLKLWLTKLNNELDDNQYFPLFIWQIYNSSAIAVVKYELRIQWDICFPLKQNGTTELWYSYLLKELLEYNFFDLLPEILTKEILIKH